MNLPSLKRLNKKFEQNFILANPVKGALIIAAFSIIFALLYRPLGAHKSMGLSFMATMALYTLVISFSAFLMVKLLKRLHFFANPEAWNLIKEVVAIIIILLGIGIIVYFVAFAFEPPANRWNFSTFFDSVKRVFLFGIIPFAFSSLLNIRQLSGRSYLSTIHPYTNSNEHPREELLLIKSKLKKEKLAFYPSQFIYAEADGNYIKFHLMDETGIKVVSIRNSISNIEQQLSEFNYFVRIHRAFIVNMKKVTSKEGNASGYRLKFKGIETELPVSRHNTRLFDEEYDHLTSYTLPFTSENNLS